MTVMGFEPTTFRVAFQSGNRYATETGSLCVFLISIEPGSDDDGDGFCLACEDLGESSTFHSPPALFVVVV